MPTLKALANCGVTKSWTAVSPGLPKTGIVSLAVNGTNLFAGTVGNGVFRSTY